MNSKKKVKNKKSLSRQQLGQRTGTIGLVLNAILALAKLLLGSAINSVSILADGFNNLTDGMSSLVTIAGFRFAAKPKDEKHPYGYGRMEYISGFIVSCLILVTSLSLGNTGISRILHPQQLFNTALSLWILVISIAVKLGLAVSVQLANSKINSAALRASRKDSIADAIVTSFTLIAYFLAPLTVLPLDGIACLMVAAVILWSGIISLKENLDLLLGNGADQELTDQVNQIVLSYPAFTKVESFVVYDYGPETKIAFLEVSLGLAAYLGQMQAAANELITQLHEKLCLDATIYLDISHSPAENNLIPHGLSRSQRNQLPGQFTHYTSQLLRARNRHR